MTLSSFEAKLYRSAFALKGHLLGHALSSFQRSLLLQPKLNLDAQASFWLPSADALSSQGNGDFTSSRKPLSSELRNFFQLRPRGRLLRGPASASLVLNSQRREVRCVFHDAVAYALLRFPEQECRLFQPMKQPLSPTYFRKRSGSSNALFIT